MQHSWRILITICLALGYTATLYSNELIPVKEFARLPVVDNPQLSPDGRRVAMTIVSKGKPLVVVQPLVPELQSEGIGKISLGDYYISNYRWGNNERLVLAARFSERNPVFKRLINFTRLLVVDWNGKNPVPITMEPNDWGVYRQHSGIVHTLPGDDKHVLVVVDDRKDEWAMPHVHKINLYTGKKEFQQKSTRRIQYWLSDPDGNILVGGKTDTRGSTETKTYYRPTEDSNWQVLQEADYFDSERLVPFRFDKDRPGILIFTTHEINDEYRWRAVDETDIELFEYDLAQGKIIGEYKNQKLTEAKSKIQNALPELQVVLQSEDDNEEKYIFKAYSDTTPPTYYLIDTKANTLQRLGRAYPRLVGKPLANMQEITYSARDGLEIPAYLTLPNGETRSGLPLIVYPHGGPWANDDWGFDAWVQFFASRGYAVLQPQYRGSTGYGHAHEQAGYKKWGAEMQDDITDGVMHLVEKGVVDKNRVCIVGASYGGYAAAWGLVKDPDLYRCGISINGVLSMVKKAAAMNFYLFGDLNRQLFNDNDNLVEFSPSHNAEKITSPLMLIASKKDTVVPYAHSKDMYKKMKKLGKEVEYLELENGEHWRTNEAVEIKILKAVDVFLQKHLPTDV